MPYTKGIPNNIMPFLTQTAIGKRKRFLVFGNDYATPDGSGVRDYIHVVDLARGHVSAMKFSKEKEGLFTFNLGTGTGSSVFEVLKAFERVNYINVPYDIVKRRAGDIAQSYANVELAQMHLGWKAEFGIDEMCRDSWNWQLKNPNGYTKK